MARPTAKNIVGARVVRARKRLKMTQLDLSRRLTKAGTTLDRAAIAKIETGIRRVTDYELLAIARKLEVEVQWLLTGRSGTRT
jgi:HTH-type transcriptional regulator, cell division transcriptional repressor